MGAAVCANVGAPAAVGSAVHVFGLVGSTVCVLVDAAVGASVVEPVGLSRWVGDIDGCFVNDAKKTCTPVTVIGPVLTLSMPGTLWAARVTALEIVAASSLELRSKAVSPGGRLISVVT